MARFLAAMLALSMLAAPLAAAAREVPYWASIRAKVLNMRAGPGRDFPIEWVYRRAGLPVKVIRVHEGWRLVRDPDGAEGWMNANLLSPDRAALVVGDELAAMRDGPAPSRLPALLSPRAEASSRRLRAASPSQSCRRARWR